jgi:hypothetical protein
VKNFEEFVWEPWGRLLSFQFGSFVIIIKVP